MNAPASADAASAQLDCPQCKASITYYDVENSTHYACPVCQTYFEYNDPKPPRIIGRFKKGPEYMRQVLPLGASGVLPDRRTYRVVGFSARHEAQVEQYKWGEYVLFSPPATYAQLAEFDGHWVFIKPVNEALKIRKPNTRQAHVVPKPGQCYDIYNRYSPRIPYAVGEFDWDLISDESLSVVEFVAPPLMLVQERNPGTKRVEWYQAEHIEPAQVAAAFGIAARTLPWRSGVGAIQPTPGEKTWKPLLNFALLMGLLLVLAQAALTALRPAKILLDETYVTERDTARTATAGQSAVIVTPPFEVHGPTPLFFELDVSLSNQWLELPVTLVNEQTGQSFEFTKSIEYYHGREGGENWSEGSTTADATIAKVPSGRYHLNIYPVSQDGQSITFRLKLIENATLQSNLLLALLLLFIYPLVQFWRRRYHEQQRWANSDYGPMG